MSDIEYEVDENGEIVEPEPELPFDEPEPEPEPEQPDEGQSLEAQRDELDEVFTALQTKGENYTKGCIKVVNDLKPEGVEVPLEVCEMCNDAYPGFRWAQPSDELHAQMYAAAGIVMGLEALEDDPDAEQCPTCKGKGIVKLPSEVAGNKARTCRRCNGAGYLDRHPESGTLVAAAVEQTNGRTEALPGVPANDPMIVDLRNRGFTVIPPAQPMGVGE